MFAYKLQYVYTKTLITNHHQRNDIECDKTKTKLTVKTVITNAQDQKIVLAVVCAVDDVIISQTISCKLRYFCFRLFDTKGQQRVASVNTCVYFLTDELIRTILIVTRT